MNMKREDLPLSVGQRVYCPIEDMYGYVDSIEAEFVGTTYYLYNVKWPDTYGDQIFRHSEDKVYKTLIPQDIIMWKWNRLFK